MLIRCTCQPPQHALLTAHCPPSEGRERYRCMMVSRTVTSPLPTASMPGLAVLHRDDQTLRFQLVAWPRVDHETHDYVDMCPSEAESWEGKPHLDRSPCLAARAAMYAVYLIILPQSSRGPRTTSPPIYASAHMASLLHKRRRPASELALASLHCSALVHGRHSANTDGNL